MFNLTIPAPKNNNEARAQADRYARAKAIIAEGYTFWPDAELESIAVCKPGRLSFDYIIRAEGCDCPDMTKTGAPCKHFIAAYILQEEAKEEEAKDAAQVAQYEADMLSCELETTGVDPYKF